MLVSKTGIILKCELVLTSKEGKVLRSVPVFLFHCFKKESDYPRWPLGWKKRCFPLSYAGSSCPLAKLQTAD